LAFLFCLEQQVSKKSNNLPTFVERLSDEIIPSRLICSSDVGVN